MRKRLLAVLVATALIVGCKSPPEVVPVVQKFDASQVLAKPPAAAMTPPVEPTPLPYGADNAHNVEIVKQNNLNAVEDRSKLRALQKYINNIFKPQN